MSPLQNGAAMILPGLSSPSVFEIFVERIHETANAK